MENVRVAGEMTVARAGELLQLLEQAIGPTGECGLDLSGVTEFDTAGLQLLLVADRVARQRGGALRITGESAEVTRVLDRCAVGLLQSARAPRTDAAESE